MSSKPRRRVRRSPDAQVADDADSQRRLLIVAWVVAGIALIALVGVLASNYINSADANTMLNFQLGGLPRAKEVLPRNFRLWTVYPNGNVRFQTAFYPAPAEVSTLQTLTVAGPLVNSAEDILSSTYFGALSAEGSLQAGPGADSGRVYEAFDLGRATEGSAYGINVLIANPPYISPSLDDPVTPVNEAEFREMAMGANPQDFYKQMVWALALPPGTVVDNPAFAIATDDPANVYRPYRRADVDGWTVYYFDVTSLTGNKTIRIRYQPAAPTVDVADPDFWKADRMR
jgi:hypothetical protein